MDIRGDMINGRVDAKSNRKSGTNGKSKKPGKVKSLISAFCAIVVICLALGGLFGSKGINPRKIKNPIVAGDLFPGSNLAEDGFLSSMTKEEILEQMQLVADANYFSFKINSRVEFENGASTGDFGIENPNYNVYPMVVRVYLGENGEDDLIFDSGGILQNQRIERAKLDKHLPAGDYQAVAYLYAYDPDTLVNIFKSAAAMEIVVKS